MKKEKLISPLVDTYETDESLILREKTSRANLISSSVGGSSSGGGPISDLDLLLTEDGKPITSEDTTNLIK